MWVGTPHEQELACMSWDQLREVADAGWEIGAHTCSHPFLTELSDEDLRRELGEAAVGVRAAPGSARARRSPTRTATGIARVAAAAGAAGYTAAVTVNTGTWDDAAAAAPHRRLPLRHGSLACACGPSAGGSPGSTRC